MLQYGWQIALDSYEKYAATGIVQLLLISSVIVLMISKKWDRKLAYYFVLITVIIFAPPIVFVIAEHFVGDDVYWRMFWLIPSVIIIALVGTKMIEQLKNKTKQRLVFCFLLIIIILGGKCVYNGENFTKATNSYKLPQEAVDICEMVAPDFGSTKIVVPESIVSYIRQYNPNIKMLYGRKGKERRKGKRHKILVELNSSEPDISYIAKYIKKKKYEYVVFENTSTGINDMEINGYELFGSTINYTIYKMAE